MTETLSALSASISTIVASVAPLLAAIRIGPNRHVTGLIWQDNTLLTIDEALPVADIYTVVLSNRSLIGGRPGPRDRGSSLAAVCLDTPWPVVTPEIAIGSVGSLVVVVGADADGSPNVRLTVVHRLIRTADGPAPMLDLPRHNLDHGSLVLDPNGRLIGLAALGPDGAAIAIPSAAIGHAVTSVRGQVAPMPAPPPHNTPRGSGWIGVALQPIILPEALVAQTGQTSGRLVVKITKHGPAAMAGIRVGDVLLALDGISACGPQAVRAFLGSDQVGTAVEVKLLRDGAVVSITVAVS